MKIKCLEDIHIGVNQFQKGEIVDLNDHEHYVRELNEDYYLVIYNGLRFDIPKKAIEIIEN
jgi:uncharacterized protein YprB with RNaseH-like and TPR domain